VISLDLINPLPEALAYYGRAVADLLSGDAAVTEVHVSAERASGSLARRLLRQFSTRGRRDADLVLVLWPAFGRWDPLTWALTARRSRVWVVCHDPVPLRPQRGHGPGAKLGERVARRVGVQLVVHSSPACEEAAAQGWTPVYLPHPVLADRGPRLSPHPTGPVLVLGQYKPTRSLAVLEDLARCPELDGTRVLRGRGWPQVPGWDVEDLFVNETSFDRLLRSARCLVLPYDRYYQSNVAVRALEAGVPVVAVRHPFLEGLLGPDWPGFVEGGGWGAAVERAAGVSPAVMAELCTRREDEARHAWRQALAATRP
jgi:hypothetical protein